MIQDTYQSCVCRKDKSKLEQQQIMTEKRQHNNFSCGKPIFFIRSFL